MTKDKKQKLDVGKIKEDFSDAELFDEKEITRLKKKRIESGTNSINFSQLFLLGYDTFFNNSHLVKDQDINSYLGKFKKIAGNIRNLIEEYGGGKEIGDYFVSQKIKEKVKLHRQIMNEMVILFARVFLEED
jgi:hypothetical protein